MKQIILVLFFLCLTIEAISQRRIHEVDSPRRRNQIYVPLSDQDRLYIAFNHWQELNAHADIDSLVQLFKHDWNVFKVTSSMSHSYTKLVYVIHTNGQKSLTPFTYPNQKKSYQVKQDSLLPYRIGADTLIIEKQINSVNKLHLPRNVRYYFVLKHFEAINTYQNINKYIQQAFSLAAQHPKKDVLKPQYMSFVNLDSGSAYPVTSRAYSSMPSKIIKLGVGTGLARDQLYTTLSGEITLLPELKRTSIRINWDEYFFFQSKEDTKVGIIRNSFLNAGLTFFQPYPSIRKAPVTPAPGEIGSLMLGYLISKQGDYFAKNTWRLTSRIKVIKRINLEPELYWNGLFKNVYPGVRLNLVFFTNE